MQVPASLHELLLSATTLFTNVQTQHISYYPDHPSRFLHVALAQQNQRPPPGQVGAGQGALAPPAPPAPPAPCWRMGVCQGSAGCSCARGPERLAGTRPARCISRHVFILVSLKHTHVQMGTSDHGVHAMQELVWLTHFYPGSHCTALSARMAAAWPHFALHRNMFQSISLRG